MLDRAQLKIDDDGRGARQTSFVRYAIYYTPRPGTALAAFGRSWFGRANDGATLQAFSDKGLTGAGLAKLPTAPGRYGGLHAVFRPPFALGDGVAVDALRTRLIGFADRRKPVETGPLTLARAGRYLVLRPVEPTPALDWLAAQCGAALDDLATPVGQREQDRPARGVEPLQFPGDAHEHRFSITLTGPLDGNHLERVTQALWPVLDDICASGVTVDALSLFGEPGGRTAMRLISRHGFGA